MKIISRCIRWLDHWNWCWPDDAERRSVDGTETLAILFEKELPFSVGEVIMFINVIIFSCAAFVYGLENALFSMLTYYIAFRTIDIVVKGWKI